MLMACVLAKSIQRLLLRDVSVNGRHIGGIMMKRRIWEGGVDEEDELDRQTKDRIETINYKLKRLLMYGHRNKAVEHWKSYRSDINNMPFSPSTYEILLCMDHSGETVEALREDIMKLGVVMSDRCGLGYVKSLLDRPDIIKVNNVLKFIEKDLVLRGSSWFISHVMDNLSERGFPQSALALSELFIPTTVIPNEEVDVIASKVRAFGHLGQLEIAQKLVSEHYPHTSSSDLPLPVRLSLVDLLCLTDDPEGAFTELSTIPSYGLQNIAYLVESVVRATSCDDASASGCGLALDVYRNMWESVKDSLSIHNDIGVDKSIKRELQRRIFIGMICLQILALKQQKKEKASEEFISHSFYSEMRTSHIQPNEEIYKLILQYSCYNIDHGLKWAENAIKRMIRVNNPPSCDAIISWCREGTCLDPDTVIKMVKLVRLHCHATDQALKIEHIEKILSTNRKSLTVKTVKIISNMMEKSGILEGSVDACNAILRAYQDANDLGAVFIFFHDLREVYSVSPNIDTYHILMDSVIQDGSHRGCYGAIYKTWRILLASQVAPDIQIIYKFIHCCRMAKDYSRAFYFFHIIESYGLLPDENTLHELLQNSMLTETV